MPRLATIPALLLVALLLPSGFSAADEAPPGLLGTWVLVEQTYGNGSSNLAGVDSPIRLRIALTAGGPSAWIWQGDDESAGSEWPAMMADGRKLRAKSREARFDSKEPALRGRCEVVPVEGEDLVLDIRETYSLSPDGKSLTGTVVVRFLGGDQNRGGYTLHRKFARER